MPDRRRRWIALTLSGIFPGLGQLYLRAWGKGAAFIIAAGVACWGLGQLVSAQDLLAGLLPNPGTILGALLALLALSVWSCVDAWLSAGKVRETSA